MLIRASSACHPRESGDPGLSRGAEQVGLAAKALGPGVRRDDSGYVEAVDAFVTVPDDQPLPDGPALISFARLQAEPATNYPTGVRLEAGESVDDLAPYLQRLAVVALVFPKFRDGRAYSAAALLRERYGFTGEIRAVGEVLREQAWAMVRVGFDAFEPADGSTAHDWATAADRYRHVYQRAEDERPPVFEERAHA